MSGMNIVLKMFLAVVVVIAAASGTEVVDVIEVAEDLTEQARGYAARIDIDGDETGLYDEQVETAQYARPLDASKLPPGAIAFSGEDDADASTDADAEAGAEVGADS